MSTTDTNNPGIKLQAAGENLNTWGDPNLNNDLLVLSNLSSKWNAITVNASIDFNSLVSNYSTSNPDEVAAIKLVQGSVTAAFNVTMTARMKRVLVWNATSYGATWKLSATSGFTLPSGCIALIGTDGVNDVYNMSPNHIGTLVTPSNLGDVANVKYVQTAVANAALPATAGTVRNSAGDTTAGYLGAKLSVTGSGAASVAQSTANPGANETTVFAISVSSLGLAVQAEQTAGFTAAAGKQWPVNITGSGTIVMPSAASLGDVVAFNNYGSGAVTFNFNGLKYYGSTTSLSTSAKGFQVFVYSNAATGWTDL